MSGMDAAILYGREDVRIERIPIPSVGPGEVRMRIRAALTCGTDVKVYRRGYHARMLTPPCRFGHEMAGEIDAVGEGVNEWKPGDRVVAANSAPCGECFFCERDQPELCEDLLFINGAYAQFITLPERIVKTNLLWIPDHLGYEEAALLEPLACVVHGIEESGIEKGDIVAVIGSGPIGLLFVCVCGLVGARVISIVRSDRGISAARRLGTSDIFQFDSIHLARAGASGGRGPDKVIECVGTPESWEQAIRLVRKGGLVNLFGGCPSGTSVNLDTGRMHYDSLTLRATFHHTPESVRRALDLLSCGRIPKDALITASAPLAGLPDVLRKLSTGGDNLKVAIHPSA